MSKIIINKKTYTGAGILILETINKRHTILVGKSSATNKYTDFGGHYEKKHFSLSETAHNELRQEMANMIQISSDVIDVLDYIDISASDDTYYRSYILKVDDVNKKDFTHNLKIMNKHNAPKTWNEVEEINNIPLDELYDEIHKNRPNIKTLDGDEIKISSRLKQLLKTGWDIIMKNADKKALFNYEKQKTTHISPNFTNNTITTII